MSLKLSSLATDKQRATLLRLGYYGRGEYALDRLTVADAAELIAELFEEERLAEKEIERDRYEIY